MAHENEYLDYTGLQTVANEIKARPKIWKGSLEDWEKLSLEEKVKYDYVASDEEDDPITAATVPYDNTESGLVSTNVQGAINEVNDKSFNTNDCLMRAKSTGWWNYGESNGLPAGLIRSGYIPKKVVFLGNSFTTHRPVESGDPEGYVWTVDDWRAMAASTPTSDWTSIVYRKLKEINPDIEVRKAAIINWEGGTLGSRHLSLCIDDESCSELKDDGGHYLAGTTIGDLLTPDVDVIIWQGYENMDFPDATQQTFEAFTNDFSNLWTELRERCPNATLYDYCGWWTNSYKDMCIVASCYKHDVEVIWQWETKLPAWITAAKPNLEAKVGDSIYDAAGNVICTVDSLVAGHANDLGHRYIAFYVLDALFNLKTHSKQSLLLGWNSEYTDPSEPGFFDRHYFGNVSYTNTDTLLTSDFSTWNDFDGVFIECNIPVTVWADNARHGVFTCEVDNKRWRYGAGPAVQKIDVLASANYGEIVYNRTWHPDVMFNEQWKDWVVTSAPMNLINQSGYVSENLSFNGLVIKKFSVSDATTGSVAIPGDGFPHAPLFAFVQDHSGGYGPDSSYRASYEAAIRINDASHVYLHTMEIKQDGTVTIDATVPNLDIIVIGY